MLSYNKVHTMFFSVTEHWVDQSRANACCLSCVPNHNGKKQNRVSKAWSDHWRAGCLCSENGANSGRRGIQMKIAYKSRSFGASSESVQTSSEDLDWGEGQLLSVQLPQRLSEDTFQPLPFPDPPCFSSLGLSFLAGHDSLVFLMQFEFFFDSAAPCANPAALTDGFETWSSQMEEESGASLCSDSSIIHPMPHPCEPASKPRWWQREGKILLGPQGLTSGLTIKLTWDSWTEESTPKFYYMCLEAPWWKGETQRNDQDGQFLHFLDKVTMHLWGVDRARKTQLWKLQLVKNSK